MNGPWKRTDSSSLTSRGPLLILDQVQRLQLLGLELNEIAVDLALRAKEISGPLNAGERDRCLLTEIPTRLSLVLRAIEKELS